jgi:hypothetical protein
MKGNTWTDTAERPSYTSAMFSPKRLSSLGLGSDPKLAFRTQPGGVAKLAEKREIAETDDAYWAQVF